MAFLNEVVVAGRLGRDIEVLTGKNGNKFASMSIAVAGASNKRETQQDGSTRPGAGWFDVVMFDSRNATKSRSESLAQKAHKGDTLLVQGSLQQRTYTDRNGQQQFSVTINARSIQVVQGFVSLNTVVIAGRLGRDITVMQPQGSRAYTQFSLAVSNAGQGKVQNTITGQLEQASGWFNVTLFDGLDDYSFLNRFAQSAHKGTEVVVEATLRVNYYQDNLGVEHKSIQLVASKAHAVRLNDAPSAFPQNVGGANEPSGFQGTPVSQNTGLVQQATAVDVKQAVVQAASSSLNTTEDIMASAPSGNMFDYAKEINIPDDDLPF